MPRKHTKKPTAALTPDPELEAKPLADFASHHAAVRDYMSEGPGGMAQADEADTLDYRLAIRQILAGQQSIIKSQDEQRAEIAKIRAKMVAYDKAAKAFEANEHKFVEDMMEKGKKLLLPKDKRDQLKAREAKRLTSMIQNVRASKAVESLSFTKKLAAMPTETVTAPGEMEVRSVQGQPVPTIVPTVVRIFDKQWVLQPGVPTVVPQVVADVLRQRVRSGQETDARKALLRGDTKDTNMAAGIQRINKEYGSPSEGFPIASQI